MVEADTRSASQATEQPEPDPTATIWRLFLEGQLDANAATVQLCQLWLARRGTTSEAAAAPAP